MASIGHSAAREATQPQEVGKSPLYPRARSGRDIQHFRKPGTAALLWKQLMGVTVLDPGLTPDAELRVYAQCMKNAPGGVTLMALNIDQRAAHMLHVPVAGRSYTLSAPELLSRSVALNDKPLALLTNGAIPELAGSSLNAGVVALAPRTITFLAPPRANNVNCK